MGRTVLFFRYAGSLCAGVLIEIPVIFIFCETNVASPPSYRALLYLAPDLILIAASIARDEVIVTVSVLTSELIGRKEVEHFKDQCNLTDALVISRCKSNKRNVEIMPGYSVS